jgi:hypothetical protein
MNKASLLISLKFFLGIRIALRLAPIHSMEFNMKKIVALVALSGVIFNTQAALTANALTDNALTANALTANALTANALSNNALSNNALSNNALSNNALWAKPRSIKPSTVDRKTDNPLSALSREALSSE